MSYKTLLIIRIGIKCYQNIKKAPAQFKKRLVFVRFQYFGMLKVRENEI